MSKILWWLLFLTPAIVLPSYVSASHDFSKLKTRLESIVECDSSQFPKNEKERADFKEFTAEVLESGATRKIHPDDFEKQHCYGMKLPEVISVFGSNVQEIECFEEPGLVSVHFNVSPDDLVKKIQAVTGLAFIRSSNGDNVASDKTLITVSGESYPRTKSLIVRSVKEKTSEYICIYEETSPRAVE